MVCPLHDARRCLGRRPEDWQRQGTTRSIPKGSTWQLGHHRTLGLLWPRHLKTLGCLLFVRRTSARTMCLAAFCRCVQVFIRNLTGTCRRSDKNLCVRSVSLSLTSPTCQRPPPQNHPGQPKGASTPLLWTRRVSDNASCSCRLCDSSMMWTSTPESTESHLCST